MKTKIKRFTAISLVILVLCSSFPLPSMFTQSVKAESVPVSAYTSSGLVPYSIFQTGEDQVVTPSGHSRDDSYIAAKGDLTIKETDLTIPGRGLNSAIERVYTTPAIFENNDPYGYESPPIDVGKGWTLNFPWVGSLLHLWDGTCYEMKWSGNVFENHKGAHFKLVKEADGTYTLYNPSGTILHFDTSGKLKTIEDNNGNKITFAYENGLLANITDTVGRVVYLNYSNNKLSRISYDDMTIDYIYSNGALVKVKDVQGRCRHYEYNSYNNWLVTKAKSPEGGYKTYSYVRFSNGSEDITYHKYRIASQKRYDSCANLVNAKIFSYTGNFSSITSSRTRIKDGNSVERVRHQFVMDSEGLTESFAVLNSSAAQTQEYGESHSVTGWRFTGDGYWEEENFQALYIDPDMGYRNVSVGPFENYPSTSGYKGYETSVSHNTITVTTYWCETTIPKLKKILYKYSSRNEVIQEDVYIGGNGSLSFSVYRRYDNWGNQIYSKNSVGHEKFYSYANTETSGIFVDYSGNSRTGFSNLFYMSAVPSNIHSALLGQAELQDNETAVETYVKYNANGDPTKNRALFGETTSFVKFSGIFDEPESTSFSIDLNGIDVQGNSILRIAGMAKVNYNEESESHSTSGKRFTGTGYWNSKYFYAYWVCWQDWGYERVGPFTHYPGTAGYKRYTTSLSQGNWGITVTTYYNEPIDCYPAKVDYHFNGYGWSTLTNNLGAAIRTRSILPLELNTGMNTLYFQESSSYKTKHSWELHVPIYTAPKEDLKTQCCCDSYGNVISVTDAEGAVTIFEHSPEYEYAYCTKTIKIMNGYNISASNTYYFSRGLVASTTDPDGHVTSFEYDKLGRTTRVANPDGSQRTIVYDDENNTVTYYDELNHKTKEYFDGLGRKTKAERYLTDTEVYSVQTFTYNHDNKILETTVPHQPGTPNPLTYTTKYNALGRVVKKTNPDGTFSTMRYDDINNTMTIIDANQHKSELKFDLAGRLSWVREYHNSSSYYLTQYDYDELGNLVKRIDARGHETTYEYGSLFGKTKKVYCDSTYEQAAYNSMGNVIWAVDRNGDNTTFTYDELHRLVRITYADCTTRNFAYDNCSRLASTSHRDYSSCYQYDSRGRVTWESHSIRGGGPDSHNVLFTYDAASRLTKMTYPDGLEVSCEYDELGRIAQLCTGDYVFASFSYNVDGTLGSISYGNSLLTTFAYDNRLRPTEIVTADPNRGNLTMLSLSYTFDNVGNILQIVNARRTPGGLDITTTEEYQYDWLDRLIYANGSFGKITYSYDAAGNIIAKTENGETTVYQYDNCNRLMSLQSETTNATFTYNNNGNLKTMTENNETWQYVYDTGNKLCQVVRDQILGSYKYDANGRRVHQLEGSKTTTTVYSGMNPIYEHIVQSANHTVFEYIYGPAGRIARKSGDQVIYYHNDHLGSTRLVTDASAAILATMSYKPFGETYESYGNEERLGFNGKEEDSQTGLYYYGARYYDPEIGRFIQADSYTGNPGDPQSQNRYVYCRNNPLRYIDPTGNSEDEPLSPEEKRALLETIIAMLEGGSECIDLFELIAEFCPDFTEDMIKTVIANLDKIIKELRLDKIGFELEGDVLKINKGLMDAMDILSPALDVLIVGLKSALYAAIDHPEACAAGFAEAVFLAVVNMAFRGLLWLVGEKYGTAVVKIFGHSLGKLDRLLKIASFFDIEDWFFEKTVDLWRGLEEKYNNWLENTPPPSNIDYTQSTLWNILDSL